MEFCLHPDKVLAMLTEIGSHRALTDEETDIVEAIVCRGNRPTGAKYMVWTPEMDEELLAASKIPKGGVKAYAEKIGVRPMSCHMRLYKLRGGPRRAKVN